MKRLHYEPYLKNSIKSSTVFNWLYIFPLGWSILYFFLLNLFIFKAATAKLSPKAKISVELLVGTKLRAASFTSGIKSFISEALYRIEFFFEVIPINVILNL